MLRTLRLENLCPTVHLDRWPELPERDEHRLEEPEVRCMRLYQAVALGDLLGLGRLLCKSYVDVDVFYSISEELKWQPMPETPFGPSGLWSLEYKRELTSPLCIAAAQGYSQCLQYLLEHGARPNLLAGGRTALHEACVNSSTECAELLLEHGANPNQLTEEGLAPLHLCKHAQSLRCAKLLVRYGAKVNTLSDDGEGESPLHVAARHGLHQHVQLYLRYGAKVNQQSSSEETALCAACGEACFDSGDEQEESLLQVCRFLLDYGADVNKVDNERRSPLHRAARNAQDRLVELLIERGAVINALDYNGCSPLSNALQTAVVKHRCRSHAVVQMLLNHGSIKVWPGALLKLLASCASAPKTVEIMFNSYDMVPVTYKWTESFPEEACQSGEHSTQPPASLSISAAEALWERLPLHHSSATHPKDTEELSAAGTTRCHILGRVRNWWELLYCK
ncbi:ankyrin repeat and SOCS box protein 18-like isoform X3 [Alosa sapidissima]|uniref:ankyrin repeat and SOCS box protein 18-like isoform X3 n=1 Tax=Alosa sapidissima TaxID=34773 RepID=UPI001C0A54BD|nr:ankyrin repeat and SOCS box protein 18-like isoform X3 [Alosa sapidissima]